jgi:hypothetical protein
MQTDHGCFKRTDAKVTKKLTSRRQIISRRRVFEIGILGAGAFALRAVQFPAFANTASTSGASSILINALLSIGTQTCNTAAKNLAAAQTSNLPFSLHLRNAGLRVSDAEVLAMALTRYSSVNGRMLQSLSVSYNPLLGDNGTKVLAKSLPQTVSEVGFVGCGMGDIGSQALLKWARQAPNLRMICVEENKLSQSNNMQFRELAADRAGLLVVV